MKRTLITILALGAMAYADNTTETAAATTIVDPTLASSENAAAQAPAADVSNLQDPLATPAIPAENLPELKEAQRTALGVFFDINAGTQGVGFDIGYEFNRYFKLRFRSGYMSFAYDDEWNDMDFEAKFKGNNTGIILDVHPFAGKFHVSAGLNFNPIKLEARGRLNSDNEYVDYPGDYYGGHYGIDYSRTYELGNYEYRLKEGVKDGWVFGEYSWRSCQPYLGIGWSTDGDGDRGLYFSFDLGVNFMGSGSLSVSSSGGVEQKPVGAPDSEYKQLDNSILKDSLMEEGKDFFKIADKLYVWPVLQIGMGLRF